ncbi:methyltransferase domain-containing protein [uncultured Psychroserpens sp.]|uniref:methyltransferase domain-containing protein n=1 Tax=uncultured Psychroserpens sp. TaxID=255436 RepID=UPI002605A100|nr:class I SAM-dependent methyltransferase [uncultured Psychroserpens sp.]
MKEKLTTRQYWEDYYSRNHADVKHIVTVCSYYDTFWEQFISAPNATKTIIEIGGFPGRYLAYLSQKYQLQPTCLDYNSDTSQIENTFKVMNVNNYSILQEDFTTFQTPIKYDYVMSNGFIEHFENFDEILDLHLSYMKDASKLLVMIPNMRGYIRIYKYLLDYNNMKIHNLKCMKLEVFQSFADRNDLSVKYLNYFGNFPLGVHQQLNLFQKILHKAHRLVFKKWGNKWVNKYPSKYFSSSIMAIFEKK